MRTRGVLPFLLLAFCFLAPSVTDAGNGLSAKVTQALRVARHADATATRALRAAVGPAATIRGAAGVNGHDGLPGAQGAAGRAGSNGRDGTPGPAGTASLDVASADNADTVTLDSASWTTVAAVSFSRATAGRVLLFAEAQLNGENATPDGAYCDFRADGTSVAQRFVAVPGDSQVSLAASAVTDLSAGPHTATLACRRQSMLSLVDVPAERARVSVLGG